VFAPYPALSCFAQPHLLSICLPAKLTLCSIVLIHGIGGHPLRSFRYSSQADIPQTPKSAGQQSSFKRKLLRKNPPLRRSNSEPLLGHKVDSTGKARKVLRKNSLKSSTSKLGLDFFDAADPSQSPSQGHQAEVYWPLDLLPSSCPNTRIMTWGYHTLIADKKPLRLQNDIFAHARELLRELAGARHVGGSSRPLVFISHSTGGTLVKEVGGCDNKP
jgi:protein SERAC1